MKSFSQWWVKLQGITFLWSDSADLNSSPSVNKYSSSPLRWVLSRVICVCLLQLHLSSLCTSREGCKFLAGGFRNPVLLLLCWTVSHPIRNKTFSCIYSHTQVYYPFFCRHFSLTLKLSQEQWTKWQGLQPNPCLSLIPTGSQRNAWHYLASSIFNIVFTCVMTMCT